MNKKYGKNWSELFVYDESSPTFLRWKHGRVGRAGVLVKRVNNGVAGGFNKVGQGVVGISGYEYSVMKIIWEMHNGALGGSDCLMLVDGDKRNLDISNMYIFKGLEKEHEYGKYLGEYLYYCEESPTKLRWKKKYRGRSHITIGDVAGSFDKSVGYYKLNALGKSKGIHKIVWALFNNFEDQSGKEVDHINGNPSDNRIENLRLVDKGYNSRNAVIQHNSRTGVNGVGYVDITTKSGIISRRYTATVYIEGKRKTKSFSSIKWGEELALLAACEWRDKMITLLNQKGAGYTERHGTNIVGGNIKL